MHGAVGEEGQERGPYGAYGAQIWPAAWGHVSGALPTSEGDDDRAKDDLYVHTYGRVRFDSHNANPASEVSLFFFYLFCGSG